MSVRRLVLTTVAMAVVALLLGRLAPAFPDAVAALTRAQRTVDTEGADALLVAAAGLAAWAVWAWGALGLLLAAASVAPGFVGRVAALLARVVLPAGARRGAAVALGLGLATPLLVGAVVPVERIVLVAAPTPAVPDWPAEAPDTHVVVPGDCLWTIAADRLRTTHEAPPTDADVASAVQGWWSVNADVIGPDADLILPGQVLRPPDRP